MAYGEVNTEFLENLDDEIRQEYHLIDVRPPEYYAQGRIPGAKNVSLLEAKEADGDTAQIMADQVAALGIKPDDKIVIYCQDGQLAAEADALLVSKGYTQTYLYDRCYPDWAADPSHPIER